MNTEQNAASLFSAVVNSTKDHNVIDAIASGNRNQKINALSSLLKSEATPRYAINILRDYYVDLLNLNTSQVDTYYDGYVATNLTGSDQIPLDEQMASCREKSSPVVKRINTYVGD
jgi:DNA polymerase III delta subunit